MTNPEQAVIDAINGLERDEIGDIVRWQLEEGMKRGDHLPEEEATEILDILAEIATGIPSFSRAIDDMLAPMLEVVMPAPGQPFDTTAFDAETRRFGFDPTAAAAIDRGHEVADR